MTFELTAPGLIPPQMQQWLKGRLAVELVGRIMIRRMFETSLSVSWWLMIDLENDSVRLSVDLEHSFRPILICLSVPKNERSIRLT